MNKINKSNSYKKKSSIFTKMFFMSVIEKFQEGLMFFNDGQLNEALAIFTSLTNEEFEDRIFKIMAYKSIANIYTLKNDYERAINYSKLAFEYYETEGNLEEKVNSILSIGNLYADKGDMDKTIEYYTKAIQLYDDNKESDPLEKAVTLLDLAVICLEKQNDTKLAKNYFDQSLALYQNHSSISVKIKTMVDIGIIFLDKGDINNTLKYFEEAVTLNDNVPLQKGQLLLDLGKSLIGHNEYDKGFEYFERGFKLFENTSVQKFAEQIVNVGLFLEKIRELDYAIEFLKRALEIYAKVDDNKGKVSVLINLGEFYSKLGQIEHSLQYYEEALENFDQEFVESEKAIILMGLGSVLSNKGKIEKALEFFNQSLLILNKTDDQNNKAKVYQLIGRTYNRMGDLEQSISYYEKSFNIFAKDEFNISREKAITINELGSIHLKLKNYDKAYEYFTKSINILDKSQDNLLKAEPLINIGLINYQKNEPEKSKEFFSKGFELLASRQDPFDILNMFEEFFQIDKNLAFEYSLNSPFGLLWVFTKYNEIIESNHLVSADFWRILKRATHNWWEDINDNREAIINSIWGDKTAKKHRFRDSDESKNPVSEASQFETNWLLKQLIKVTQEPLTNDTIVNMLVGANDLLMGGDSEESSLLRDVQSDLEPNWFVELPLNLTHNDKYLKIRLNNRIKRFGRLIGYPLLTKIGGSIKTIKITFETQWLQRYVIDHLFVPNSQYEYESYEINPANTWLTDVYIMDLGENVKKFNQVELTYKIELELETKNDEGKPISIKSTNKRLVIPIYRKNNFEGVEKFLANNSNALAIMIALVSFGMSIFDITANWVNYPEVIFSWFANPVLFSQDLAQLPFYILFFILLFFLITGPIYLWGKRKKKDSKYHDEKISY
jgi:tetratricopeptide (TPR) repeat protein